MSCEVCKEALPDPLPADWFIGWDEDGNGGVYCPRHVTDEVRLWLLEGELIAQAEAVLV